MPIRARIVVGPRFELFLAFGAVLGPEAAGETVLWLNQARRKLDQAARRRMGDLALAPALWPALAAALEGEALEGDTDAVIAALADLPAEDFARRSRRAMPAAAGDPALERLAQRLETDPGGLQQAAVESLRRFDRAAFAALWRRVLPDLEAAAHHADALGVTAEDATEVIVFPSLFGERRFRFGDVLMLTVLPERLRVQQKIAPARHDPELVFRALGDATRYAIARLIAREALTGAELARRLGVSSPTLTHHLRALRQARLVIEERHGNRILLRLDRRTIDTLSLSAAANLFGDQPLTLRRSRRG